MSIDAWISRRLAEQNKTNYKKFDEAWKPILSWVELGHTEGLTMAGIQNQELKYYDRAGSFTPVIGGGTANPIIVGLNYGFSDNVPGDAPLSGADGIEVGTGVSQRIGNEVTFKKLRMGLLYTQGNYEAVTIRCIILRTRGIPNTGGNEFPVPSDKLLALSAIDATTALAQVAPRAIETQKSSGQVLWEDFLTLSSDTKMDKLTCEIDLDFTSKWYTADGTQADITENGFTLYMFPHAAGGGTTNPKFHMFSRMLYTDS